MPTVAFCDQKLEQFRAKWKNARTDDERAIIEAEARPWKSARQIALNRSLKAAAD